MSIGMRLTAAGKKVLAHGLLGEEILFTKVAIGDGEFDYETESVYDLTELRSWRMDLPLTAKEIKGDGTVYIEAYLSNAEVYQGFACREHALIAVDQTTGKEIIYAYRNCGNEYDFIPSNSGTAHKNIYLEYICEIQDAENINALLDLSVAYINRETFNDHVNSEHPHLNTPNHYANVTSTDYIWGTDVDNHLHKISVNNLKALLREDAECNCGLSDEEKVFAALNELGLNANLLVVEDFTGESVTDNYKIKITSSAEGGALLGLESIADLKTGAYYTISDGYNAETVQIKSVRYNISGYHAVLFGDLSNSYDWNNTYLYRTTTAGADKRVLDWLPAEGFSGVSANIERALTLDASIDNANNFEITGDGVFDVDGYFTLAR